ncbi:MAG TPA: aspartate-semialdehyde dehydrogenase [Bacteroidia bacterium]|nr:aspartate-semialdehyde dehydrogenase [Bacteroidia bacterium]
MKVAVVGATGLVGSMMIKILEERNFPVSQLIPVASSKSVGSMVLFKEKKHEVIGMEDAINLAPDIALFSAGGNVSLAHAEKFASKGTVVIDNSSAWRMHPNIKLVVPEVNGNVINSHDKIIANPNCSTIQMVMVLYPLHQVYKIKRVVVSTYQSVTGTGAKAVKQLMEERSGKKPTEAAYPYQIDLNVIPQIDVFMANNYTKEEMKMVNETKKIMGDEQIKLTSTAVRIPVIGGHSESVNIEFENSFDIQRITEILEKTSGVILQDNIHENVYPMPFLAHNKDEVFVGRIRRDESIENGLNLWIVSDNLRKGAATNAIQIAELMMKQGFLKA